MQLHDVIVEQLDQISRRHPCLIEGPYGTGVMIAFTPFKGQSVRVNEFIQKLFDAGVMGFVAGSDPTRVRFLIPFGAVTIKDIQEAMHIVEKTLLDYQPTI